MFNEEYWDTILLNPDRVINGIKTPCYEIPADDLIIMNEGAFLCYANAWLEPNPAEICNCLHIG